MRAISIGFSRPKGFKPLAWFIQMWQGGTPYSHVYLRVHSSYTNETLVYQASHGLVNCMHYDNFLAKNVVVDEFVVDIDQEGLRYCLKRAQQLLGRPYGYLGLLKLGLRKIGIKWPGDGLKTLHCSEFILTLFPDLSGKRGDYIEPVDLYKVLENVK